MSLVYNNKKLIGKCSKFAFEKVQGTSPFVMLENFESKQPPLNEKQLKTIKSWGNLKAGEFGKDWTEDDELTYRELFGESLMVLPDEVEEESYE